MNISPSFSDELPFKAYFLKGGDPDFTIHPENGILPPIQSFSDAKVSGLEFMVTWLPKSYSKCKGARLIIEVSFHFTSISF